MLGSAFLKTATVSLASFTGSAASARPAITTVSARQAPATIHREAFLEIPLISVLPLSGFNPAWIPRRAWPGRGRPSGGTPGRGSVDEVPWSRRLSPDAGEK